MRLRSASLPWLVAHDLTLNWRRFLDMFGRLSPAATWANAGTPPKVRTNAGSVAAWRSHDGSKAKAALASTTGPAGSALHSGRSADRAIRRLRSAGVRPHNWVALAPTVVKQGGGASDIGRGAYRPAVRLATGPRAMLQRSNTVAPNRCANLGTLTAVLLFTITAVTKM